MWVIFIIGMNEAMVQIDQNERLLLPAKIRKKCNIKYGDIFIMRVIKDKIRIISLNQSIEKAQNMVHKHAYKNISLVDELVKIRRDEVSLQEKKIHGRDTT